MKFSLTTKLGFLSFGGVYLALAVILGSLYVLRAEGRLIKQLDEVGATLFREPFTVNTFELLDQNTQEYTLENLRGDWNLVFFGFTSCPDICPLTMGELDKFARSWSESEQDFKPKIIMATVDPANDSPAEMKRYLSRFDNEFVGLTGDPMALNEFAKAFFVGFGESEKAESKVDESHAGHSGKREGAIDHSSHVSIVDPEGKFVAALRPPHRARDIVKAMKLITRR